MTVRWLVAAYGSAIGISKWGTPVRNVLEECAVCAVQTPYLRATAS